MRGTSPLDPAATTGATVTASRLSARLSGVEWRSLLLRRESSVAILLVVGSIVFNFIYPVFLTGSNLNAILINASVVALISVGMTMIIVTGGIDVSIGSMLGMSMLVAVRLESAGQNLLIVLGSCIGVGLLMGLTNGVLIAYGRLHPVIVTLGTLNIIRALQEKFLGPLALAAPPNALGRNLALANFLGIPAPFWLVLLCGLADTLFLSYRPLGLRIYAVGGNPEAARLAGVNVRLVTIFVYVLTGMLVGFASVIQLGLADTVDPGAGIGWELQVIAATVIGGTSILGGRGTILGSILGALLVESVHNGMVAIGTVSLLDNLVVGVLIVVAVSLDLLQKRKAVTV